MPWAAARSLRARGACLGARRRPRVCFIRSAIAGAPRTAWAAQVWAPAAAHGALGSAWLDLAWPGPTRLDRLHGLTTASGALRGRPQATFRVTPLPTGPRLDRPETANRLAGRSPPRPEPTVRVDVTPRERLPHARTTGRGPVTSDVDYRTRSPLRPGAGHRVGIQNLPAGRPLPLTANKYKYAG